jgi:hypothetical protein
VLEGMFNGILGYFMKDDAMIRALVRFGHLGQVPGDGLTLAVRVGSQVYSRGILGGLFKLIDKFGFGSWHYIFGQKTLFNVHANLAPGQISDMPERSPEAVALTEYFTQRPGFSWRFYYY